MPDKPMRPCGAPGCQQLTRNRYCAEHVDQARQNNHHYDRHLRNKKAADFYHSIEWGGARQERLLIDFGLCQDCLLEKRITPADVVDHVKPIEWFWELRLTVTNLRSLCHMHHNQKTAEDKKRYGGMKRGSR